MAVSKTTSKLLEELIISIESLHKNQKIGEVIQTFKPNEAKLAENDLLETYNVSGSILL